MGIAPSIGATRSVGQRRTNGTAREDRAVGVSERVALTVSELIQLLAAYPYDRLDRLDGVSDDHLAIAGRQEPIQRSG